MMCLNGDCKTATFIKFPFYKGSSFIIPIPQSRKRFQTLPRNQKPEKLSTSGTTWYFVYTPTGSLRSD